MTAKPKSRAPLFGPPDREPPPKDEQAHEMDGGLLPEDESFSARQERLRRLGIDIETPL